MPKTHEKFVTEVNSKILAAVRRVRRLDRGSSRALGEHIAEPRVHRR